MPDRPLKKLSRKHLMFCERFLTHFCGARAAREAGYSLDGAKQYACFLLNDPLLKECLAKRTTEIMKEISQEQLKVFRELMNLATSDIRLLYNEDGSIKPMDQWPDNVALCVSAIKHKQLKRKTKDGTKTVTHSIELKLWNKNQALENLARVLGMVTNDLNVNLPENVGSIYFPAPKEVGAPVDPAVIIQHEKIKMLQRGEEGHGKGKIKT